MNRSVANPVLRGLLDRKISEEHLQSSNECGSREFDSIVKTESVHEGWNISWHNGSLQIKPRLDYGMQWYART